MLLVHCSLCKKEMDELGAILLAPPDAHGDAHKDHYCVECYKRIVYILFELATGASIQFTHTLIPGPDNQEAL